jgi:AraC-like DNA-binding protein
MLYWYVRSVLTDSAKLYPLDIWHFLPMGIYFIAAMPEGFLPWHEKVELATKAVEDPGFICVYQATLLTEIFPQVAVFLSRLLLILGYTLWSMGLLFIYLEREESSMVFSKQLFMKKWLFCLLGFVFVLVATQIPLVIKSFQLHFGEYYFTLKVIQGISVTGLIGLLISPFLFPSVLYGLPRIPELAQASETKIKDPSNQTESPKRNLFSFESDYLNSIEEKAVSYMEQHKPYLEPDCNLAYFSKLINIPAHHLAYYFREVKKQPFTDFRNEWRINHAKTLIKDGKANEITLEAIGLQSGFSSRNAFITDFKKIEGVSPGVFASRRN